MSLMSMLEQAQGGRFFAAVAESLDLDEGQTRKAMSRLCPAIAERLHARAVADDGLFQSLLDLIADNSEGSLLEDREAMTGTEAIAGGNAILDDVFGSRSDAMAALRETDATIPERELSKLAPISATAVLAALARANQPSLPLGLAGQPLKAAGGSTAAGGFFSALVSAIVAGVVAALTRKLASPARRRRTTGYARTRSRRSTAASRSRSTRSRRTAEASVEDVFRDILGKLGK